MLKPVPPDRTEKDIGSLITSMHAVQFLYEESLGNGNVDITLLLLEALTCGDELIAGKQEISYTSKEGFLYLYFLKAILGLRAEKIAHLVALLRWLEIIPRENESGKPAKSKKDSRTKRAKKT